ncbi:hypothetical protein XGA_0377 [Xanthomonas hortorum ATCC 19865]|nr:hypothetical protein XGA_0377 [Xanthomonas hortorum ATCC 19865]
MPGDIGIGMIQALVLEQFFELGLGFATQACFFLLQSLGFDTLVLLALRTDRIGLGQIDVFARAYRLGPAALCSGLLRTWRRCRLAIVATLRPARACAFMLAIGRRSGVRPLRSPALAARRVAAGRGPATVAMLTRGRPCVGFAFGLGGGLEAQPKQLVT